MKWTHLNVLGVVFWQLHTQTARSDKIHVVCCPWRMVGSVGSGGDGELVFRNRVSVEPYTCWTKATYPQLWYRSYTHTWEQEGEVIEGVWRKRPYHVHPFPSREILSWLLSKRCRKFSWGRPKHIELLTISFQGGLPFPQEALGLEEGSDFMSGCWARCLGISEIPTRHGHALSQERWPRLPLRTSASHGNWFSRPTEVNWGQEGIVCHVDC